MIKRRLQTRKVQTGFGLVAMFLIVVGGLGIAMAINGRGPNVSPEVSPSGSPWPPTRVIESNLGTVLQGDGGNSITLPALQAAYYRCHLMQYKHEYWAFAHMGIDATLEHITIDQWSETSIAEEFFHHPIDTGVLEGSFDRSWIEDYLGHPLPDGYFLWAAQACVMDFLDAPPSMLDDMLATGPEDGERTATWDTYRATWTNDGDAGPDVVFSYEKP